MQLELFHIKDMDTVVNVSSVKQRSPFRYPGGKTWLIPVVRQWLTSLANKPEVLIEPFAGGGIVSLSVAAENLADHVLMIELDSQVAAVWKTILGDDAEWLSEKILNFNMTYDNLQTELSKKPENIREDAFRTILRNRTSHGGILANGAGLLKNGESGKGIFSRWYPVTLSRRILNINKYKDRIDFLQDDGIKIINNYKMNQDVVYFIDPPYTAAGKKAGMRLYKHNQIDHEGLFTLLESVKGEFLMTYDNEEKIIGMAVDSGFKFEKVAMSNTHHAKMNELIISKNLDWLNK